MKKTMTETAQDNCKELMTIAKKLTTEQQKKLIWIGQGFVLAAEYANGNH